MSRPEEALLGRTIGGCRVVSMIGGGGMGVVYRAVQERLQAPVAVKVIRQSFGQEEQIVARFEREAHEIAKLRGVSPNVVQVYDFGLDEESGSYYITMELVSGEGVDRILRRRGALPEDDAARIIRQAATGLEAARQLGMVHRDVKPENLLLARDGVVKITDFGLAKRLGAGATMTASGQILGTPAYMSPQQAEGMEVDHRSDVYSLGATLFSLVTGGTPFKSDTPIGMALQHIRAPVPSAREIVANLSERMNGLIMRMMAKDPDARCQAAGEVVETLDAFLPPNSPAGSRTDREALARLVEVEEEPMPATPAGASTPRPGGGGTPRPSVARPHGGAPPGRAETLDEPAPSRAEGAAPAGRGQPVGDLMAPTLPPIARAPAAAVAATAASTPRRSLLPLIGALGGIAAVAAAAILLLRDGGSEGSEGASGEGGPPKVTLKLSVPDEPEEGALFGSARVRVKGRFLGPESGAWVRVNGTEAAVRRDVYSADLNLGEGAHGIRVEAGVGTETLDSISLRITVDVALPAIEVSEPDDGLATRAAAVTVAGRASDTTLRAVRIGGKETTAEGGVFRIEHPLAEGPNAILVEAEDALGRKTSSRVGVVRDTEGPALEIEGGESQLVQTTAFTLRGRARDALLSRVTVAGEDVPTGPDGTFSRPLSSLEPGRREIPVVARDRAGNETGRTVVIVCRPLPDALVPGPEAGVVLCKADGAAVVLVGSASGAFYVDRDEVTVARYARFLEALAEAGEKAHAACGAGEPPGKDHTPADWANQRAPGREELPVRGLDWWDALAYARWAGKDLPTEAEWVAAAGGEGREFPWGGAPPTAARAVLGLDVGARGAGPDPAGGREAGASPSGARDLAGNVAEWCLDADVASPGGDRLVKGGSWADDAGECRTGSRRFESARERLYTVGFRCVLRPPKAGAGGGSK